MSFIWGLFIFCVCHMKTGFIFNINLCLTDKDYYFWQGKPVYMCHFLIIPKGRKVNSTLLFDQLKPKSNRLNIKYEPKKNYIPYRISNVACINKSRSLKLGNIITHKIKAPLFVVLGLRNLLKIIHIHLYSWKCFDFTTTIKM